MRIIDRFLLGYSYTFHLVLVLAALAFSVVVTASDNASVRLSMLPFTGPELERVVLYSALIGLATILLGITGVFRYAFPVWALLVLVQLARWTWGPGTTFQGRDQFQGMVLLIVGALGAFLSSLIEFKKDRVARAQRRPELAAAANR